MYVSYITEWNNTNNECITLIYEKTDNTSMCEIISNMVSK